MTGAGRDDGRGRGEIRYTFPVKNVLLVVLDGWGHSDFGPEPEPGNAIELAKVPVFKSIYRSCPRTRLACSGLDVGLPDGLMGNSEVGHLNLGAGRIVPQDIARIDRALEDGSLAGRFDIDGMLARLEEGGRLHLIGLVSDGGVHSHVRHLLGLLDLLPPDAPVRVHAITDGRDASPTGSAQHVEAVEKSLDRFADGRIATVSGRYWTMDRDRRWERTERAWRAIVDGRGAVETGKGSAFLHRRYSEQVTDEFVEPAVLAGHDGISGKDAVILLNFRADRMRQLAAAFAEPEFDGFERAGDLPAELRTMTEYRADLRVRAAFPPKLVRDCLGEVVSRSGLRQLRVAETEKYAHVTYFFNGGEEEPFPGEDRVLAPSPKVATYDLHPRMSARQVTDAALRGLQDGYSFVLVNFANPDMVGHTGSIPAAVKAVETVDACLGELLDAVRSSREWVALVTADHGNCERMLGPDGSTHTAHTVGPVDLVLVDPSSPEVRLREDSGDPHRLADVAPTVLGYLGLDQPEVMTGRDLSLRSKRARRNP